MDAGHEDRWFKGIKSYMFSQAALSVTTYIRTIKVNVHGEGNVVSVGLITVGSMIYQFSDETMILLSLSVT